MTVSYDNASGSKESAPSPLTWSHTIGSGSNRLLVVGVTNNNSAGTVSVTYNSVSMTEWSHYHAGNDTSHPFLTFFYMKEANLPSSGAYNVVVTYGGGTTVVTAGAISFAGADQTTPLQNEVKGSQGGGSALTVTITSSSGNMAVLFAGSGSAAGTLGGTGSPTERVRQDFDGSAYMNNIVGVTAPGAASVQITYTDISDWYTWIGADVKANVVILDQEGFRFRNDDGDEDAATWKEAQDTNLTAAKSVNTRLRVILDATGDPATTQYQLEYRRSGQLWRKVEAE